jgi:hypothetical protein
MGAHLKSQGFESGAPIAVVSKNFAHFFMAKLAIWMAGAFMFATAPKSPGFERCRYLHLLLQIQREVQTRLRDDFRNAIVWKDRPR